MKYLITGDNGLIGKELKKQINGEVFGYDMNDAVMEKNVDAIIHLGNNCIIRDIIKNPQLAKDNMEINFQVYEHARLNHIPNVIFFSSSRVKHYQSNPYVASKRFGEELAKAYYDCYAINSYIIRPECVWAESDKHNRVMTNWIKSARSNSDIIVYGNESKELSPIHVESFVKEFCKLLPYMITGQEKRKVISISGVSRKVPAIIDLIKFYNNSESRVFYKTPEITQPQVSTHNDIQVDDLEHYLMMGDSE